MGLGSLAEVLALVTWNLSWPALIVQARLVTIGRQYEEAAADLGATPWQVTYRVLVRLLTPAIFASAVLVFSGVIDDFVLVDLLSSNSSNTPMSVYIYSQQHGGNGGPALNALGTIMLVMSFAAVIIGYVGYRWLTRGERGSRLRPHHHHRQRRLTRPLADELPAAARLPGMTYESCPPVSVSRTIGVPAEKLFDILARPASHPLIDGSGMVREASSDGIVTGVGDVFSMKMHNDEMGDYEMSNHVVQYELNRLIGWEPP